MTYGIVSIMYIAKTDKHFNGLKVKFDNYHQMVKKVFSLRLDLTHTDLAKCIIMSAVGRFIICKVDRVMF